MATPTPLTTLHMLVLSCFDRLPAATAEEVALTLGVDAELGRRLCGDLEQAGLIAGVGGPRNTG